MIGEYTKQGGMSQKPAYNVNRKLLVAESSDYNSGVIKKKKIGNSEQGSGLFRVIPVADMRSRS
ncbi:MAG: hypothetical protein ACTHLE_11840 [Agriterribacter sp.]